MPRRSKHILLIFFLLALVSRGSAQVSISDNPSHFGIGINGGSNIGDYSDLFSANLGVDLIYLYSFSPRFHLGATSGYAHYFSDEQNDESIQVEDIEFIPLAVSIRVSPLKNLLGGADVVVIK